MDALAMTLKTTYDAYGECAATHAALVDWVDSTAGQKTGHKDAQKGGQP